MSSSFLRAFTVEEANGFLPTLEAALRKLDLPRSELEARMGRIQVPELIWGAPLGETPDGRCRSRS